MKYQNKSFLAKVVILLFFGIFCLTNAAEKCNMTETMADDCGKRLMIIGDRDFKIPKDEGELKLKCDKIFEGIDCMKSYGTLCLDHFSKQIMNMVSKNGKIMADQNCKTVEGRTELVDKLSCFQTDENLGKIHFCMEKYIVQMENLGKVSGDFRIPATCCTFHMMRTCMRENAAKVCDREDAVEFIANIVSSVTGDLVNFACGKFKTLAECDANLDPTTWSMLKELVASDDPAVIAAKKQYSSPFVALKNIIKQFKS